MSLLVFAACIVYICWAAGKSAARAGVHPAGLNRLPLDVYALAGGLSGWLLGDLAYRMINYWVFNGITLIMIVVSYLRRRLDIERFMTGLWLLLLVPGFVPACKWICPYVNISSFIYTILFGILLLCRGFRRNHFTIFNGGMLLISSQFIVKFFCSDVSSLYRAIAFCVVGLAFIVANIVFARRMAKGGVK